MMAGSYFVDAQALFELIAILLEGALFAVAVAVALWIAAPSLEQALLRFERWCGRGR